MKNLNKLFLATAMLASSASYAADVSTTISATDDYRFRGISQSAGDAALQGSLDIAFDSGFYAGAWASNIDFGGDGDTEVDYYAGYYTDLNDELGLDVTLYHYTYPGLDYDGDYTELASKLFYKGFTFEAAYTDDFAGSDETGTYVALNYDYTLWEKLGVAENVTLVLHAGHSAGDYWDEYDIGSYSDYSVGIATDLYGFNVTASYIVNNVDSDMEVDNNEFRNDNTVNISISKTFDLASF